LHILGQQSVNHEHWRVTKEQPKLSLEQWRLTTDNGDHSLELWRLVMEPCMLPKSVEVILKFFRSSRS
jgi:hypothetical protein